MDRFRVNSRHSGHREVRFDRIRDVRLDRYADIYGDLDGDFSVPERKGDSKHSRQQEFRQADKKRNGIDLEKDSRCDRTINVPRIEVNGDVVIDRNGDVRQNINRDMRNDRIGEIKNDRVGEMRNVRIGEESVDDFEVIRTERREMKTRTMPALVQEAPPVVRRREKKKDNSGNRRSRPASWFVSHFSFDKLFHRGDQNRNKTKSKKESKELVKPPETVLAEVHTREVQRLEALCETRTKQLNIVKLQLQQSNTAFDGMSVVVNYLANDLDGFACPGLKLETERLKEALNNEKTKIAALEEQKSSLEGIITQLKEQHKEYVKNLESESEQSLNYQKESLTSEHQEEISNLKQQKATEITEIRKAHEEYIAKLQHEHAVAVEQLKTQNSQRIKDLQGKHENQMEELHKQHQDKLEEITGRFDSIKLTLSDKVESLRKECDRLRDRARSCEEALQRDSDFKVQCALAPYKNLPQEIESLKTVLEMRNEEINKLRSQNDELKKKLEELPIAQEKIITLQQKKENLEAIISMKTDHEKVLHERCQSLMRKYDKESRANKRLSMEYEELMYKLSESFSESEIGAQEAMFYQKLGISPNSSGEFLGSPGPGRKLRIPSSSGSTTDSSPSKSPVTKRTLSANLDDREEKKLKRRSGNYLLDERKQRSPSPLTQNPLTKSWSPSSQSESPIRVKKGRDGNKMSQSWCVDMDTADDQLESGSKIPRSKSSSEKGVRRRLAINNDRGDSEEVFVSKEGSESPCRLGESELSSSMKSNGIPEEILTSSVTKSGRATVTLSDSYDVFMEDEKLEEEQEHIPTKNTNQATVQIHRDSKSNTAESTSGASLAYTTVSCPVSKLPVKTDDRLPKEVKTSPKSHTETTV